MKDTRMKKASMQEQELNYETVFDTAWDNRGQ